MPMSGCLIFGGKDKRRSSVTFKYPADIKDMCTEIYATTCAQMVAHGANLPNNASWEVRKHKGEVKIGDSWYWSSEYWPDIWVGGLCWGNMTEVGCNPNTMGEVSYGTVFHETGHYWLMNNGGSRRHLAQYKPVFGASWDDGLLGDDADRLGRRKQATAVDGIPKA